MTTKRDTAELVLQELRAAVAHVSDTAADDACACRPTVLAIAGDVVVRLSRNGIPLALAVPTLVLVAEYFFDAARIAVRAATEDEAARLQADELLEALHEVGMNALPELKGRLTTVVGTSDEIAALRAQRRQAEQQNVGAQLSDLLFAIAEVVGATDNDEEFDPEDYGTPFSRTKGGDA